MGRHLRLSSRPENAKNTFEVVAKPCSVVRPPYQLCVAAEAEAETPVVCAVGEIQRSP